ncbi:MAG: hypothetical protein ACYTG0_46280 [Planctomycetota bacterium]
MPTVVASVEIVFKRYRDEGTALLFVTALCFIAAFTLIGLDGRSFQTRYILPAIPPLCVLAGLVAYRMPRWVLVPFGLALLFQIYNVYQNVGTRPGIADVFVQVPFKEMLLLF